MVVSTLRHDSKVGKAAHRSTVGLLPTTSLGSAKSRVGYASSTGSSILGGICPFMTGDVNKALPAILSLSLS